MFAKYIGVLLVSESETFDQRAPACRNVGCVEVACPISGTAPNRLSRNHQAGRCREPARGVDCRRWLLRSGGTPGHVPRYFACRLPPSSRELRGIGANFFRGTSRGCLSRTPTAPTPPLVVTEPSSP